MQKLCMARLLERPKAQNISVHRRRNSSTQDSFSQSKYFEVICLRTSLTVTEVDVLRAIFFPSCTLSMVARPPKSNLRA
jgi:hypothetical protein